MKKLYFLLLLMAGMAFAQPAITNPATYQLCDGNNDSFEMFDLTSRNAEILGALSPALYTVSYYADYLDMTNDVNSLSSPYQNTVSGHQSIYVKVVENANLSNFATTILNLKVNYYPGTPEPMPYQAVYENPNDGVATFNLTSYINTFLTGQTNIAVSFYLTQADAQNQVSPINNPSAYTGSNFQTIWMYLVDTTSGCSHLNSFQLRVLDSAQVINIPDLNLRTRLIGAGPSNTIAKDNNGNYVAIDTNGDGAIQFSEAVSIVALNISNANTSGVNRLIVSSMEGIQFFSNLTSLDCSYNSLTGIYESNLTSLTKLNCAANNLTSINLSILPNLTDLDCSVNTLSNLDLVNSGNLQRLACRNCSLNALDLSFVPGLNTLDCGFNSIQNLNLSAVPGLQFFLCDNNLLTSLDMLSIPELIAIHCENNSIADLNLSSSPQLGILFCSNNQLTSLDLSNLHELNVFNGSSNPIEELLLGNFPGISQFELQYTLISSIDASMIHSFGNYQFNCNFNPNLISANIKGYNNYGYYSFFGCPNLAYLCVRDDAAPYYQNLALAWSLPNLTVNSYCSFDPGGNYNTITGAMTFDANNNGCGPDDVLQPNIRVNINDQTNQGASFTNIDGNYTFYTQAGSFDITPAVENPAWFTFSPTSATIPFADNNNNTVTQNFCITANGSHQDLEMVMVPIIPARPGFDAVYKLVYRNKGNTTMQASPSGIILIYNIGKLTYVSSSQPVTATGTNSLNFDYPLLPPFASGSIEVTFHVNAPTDTPAVNIGEVLQFMTMISPNNNDENIPDNTFHYDETVVGSFDPNDITCLEGEVVPPSEIGKYLHYVINFENTGTADAENIVVKDIIDTTKYDVSSLQVLDNSHPVFAKLTGNVAEFIFQNINLHSGGHGNILLKIKSKNDLAQGDTVSKQANIFFDYNAPISTNMENTIFQTLSTPGFEIDNSISIYPNPAKSIINIKANNTIKSVQLYDVQGRVLQTNVVNETNANIDISDRANGIYFLKVLSDKGVKVEKIVKE